MKYDGKIDIATGMAVNSKVWKNKKIDWSKLVQKLENEHKTNETLKEFLACNKEDQTKIKDVGGYVGGYLRKGKRSPENVVHRQLLTLDVDFANSDFWDDFTLLYDNAAVLHGTHKHTEASPRLRLIMPLSRDCSPDEYVAAARRIAGDLGIELFDNTTFETNRLMFWPSTPKDQEYYVCVQDGAWIDVDELLDSYQDWTDSSLWPTSEKQLQRVKNSVEKQEDPKGKKGVVGAFCRSYSITEVIDQYLSDIYVPAGDGRYTYVKGSTASGLVIYDDLFAFSHHGTDPCGGKLCNAFDLVRLHKFGHMDSDKQSFTAMEQLATKDQNVKLTIASESLESARYEFSEEVEEIVTEESLEWMKDLEIDSKGNYLSTAVNVNLIFQKDAFLSKAFKQNVFDNKRYVFKSLPWRKITTPEPIKNVDYSGTRNYIESIYGITGNLRIDDSMALEFEKQSYHPVRDYLTSLQWDGKQRVDTLLIDYFGTKDNVYTREAIRKMLVGAVGRILVPGIKFDLVLTLVSEQGTGKSTFINKLGKQWFSDSFMTVNGKEAFEQIQGAWLIEMAELSGLRKSDVEAVKHFISKQEDTFRPAYGRTPETYKRQCVFFGTTNNKDFLRDPSGNRRFMPVDVNEDLKTKDVFIDLDTEVDQIWAEAVHLFNNGEKLYLSEEAETIARKEQREHSETDERRGLIEDYLDRKLPKEWDNYDVYERRTYVMEDDIKAKGTLTRDVVCVAEIWCELLGKEKEDMDRYKTRELNDILKSLEGWEQSNSTKNFKLYGKQKYYARRLY